MTEKNSNLGKGNGVEINKLCMIYMNAECISFHLLELLKRALDALLKDEGFSLPSLPASSTNTFLAALKLRPWM